jgi:hypothetical protein
VARRLIDGFTLRAAHAPRAAEVLIAAVLSLALGIDANTAIVAAALDSR